jgi:hypothetical protein
LFGKIFGRLVDKLNSEFFSKIRSRLIARSSKINMIKAWSVLSLLIMMLIIIIIGKIILKPEEKSTEKESSLIYEFDSEGFVLASDRLFAILSGEQSPKGWDEIKRSFSSAGRLVLVDGNYYIETEEVSIKLDKSHPLFINDGSYIYLYHNDFKLVNEQLDTIAGRKGGYISGSGLFNEKKTREIKDIIIALQLYGELYMGLEPFKLEIWDKTMVIPMNSIVLWRPDSISYINLYDDSMTVNTIKISDPTAMINFCWQRLSYSSFFEKLINQGGQADRIEKLFIQEELYQYYMSNKYTYSGDKSFYRISGGYCMESDEGRNIISDEPLYVSGERKIILPADYVLVQPKLYTMNRASALSEITMDTNAVYIKSYNDQAAFTDLFLYNGKDTYIFFDYLEIYWGEKKVGITPFSFVTTDSNGNIDIYNYENEEYVTEQIQGYQDVFVKLKDGATLNLSNDIMYCLDGQEFMLFKHPSLLNEVQ